MKQEYVLKIIELLQKCDDTEIFDIIFHILQKNSLQKH